MTFYTLLTSLLNTYSKEQIFLRTSQSLGHAYKEIDIPTIQENENNHYNLSHDSNHTKETFYSHSHNEQSLPTYIQTCNSDKDSDKFVEVMTYFFGLFGANSPLPNIPQQIPIIQSQKNILGHYNNILKENFVLGSTSLSHQNKICITLHNISYYEALLFLPAQEKYNKLKESIIFLTNNTLSVDIALHTKYHKKMHYVLGDNTCAKLGFGILGDMSHTLPQSYYVWLMSLCE